MALFHRATLTPTKAELIQRYVAAQPWGDASAPAEIIGTYRFDDPEGEVGLEGFIVAIADGVVHVPLTYRDRPVPDGESVLVATTEHSALGTRWVYDGLTDPRFVMLLAAFALTGQGEALGMAEVGGRWLIAPSNVRIHGGGWSQERVAVDGMERVGAGGTESAVFANDGFVLTVFRRLHQSPRRSLGVVAEWDGAAPVLLAHIERREG